uniref:Jnk-SapK_ap_N domain-containing protein n=1 Tax=Panagrellus redivivus TaxID=6233 RepID=A0A7E4VZ15_PANRE
MSSSGIGSPCTSPSRSPLKDIFDVCRPIKEQLEIMQANYGEDSIFNLTVPVLAALEELERYKLLYDEERHRASEDHATIDRLERELRQRHDEKKRLQEELVESEAANQEELANAYKAIHTLKDENKKLKQRIAVELANETLSDTTGSSLSEEEAQAMDNLRNRYAKEHERVREITDQLDAEKQRVNDLRENIERLLHQNKEILRKNKSLANQTKKVIQERSDIQKQFNSLEQQILKMTNDLKEARIHSNDLAAESLDSRFAGDDVPKFTEKELQEVFMSKVKLMERVTELELQLDRYKTTSPDNGERLEEFISRPPSTAPSTSPSEVSQKSDKTSHSQSSEECLVYGPINREPEEKLNPWKFEKKESGVRKFFSVLFKNVSASPRRTSTTPDLN